MKTVPVKLVLSAVLSISLIMLLCLTTFAGRRVEKREEATLVFTGTVKTVQATTKERTIDYVVEVTVESVEKGQDIKAGDTLPINCYMRNNEFFKKKSKEELREEGPGSAVKSYKTVPNQGERIKVYAIKAPEAVRLENGSYDGFVKKYFGIFPDWYDLIKG
jgi:hypothetical protein